VGDSSFLAEMRRLAAQVSSWDAPETIVMPSKGGGVETWSCSHPRSGSDSDGTRSTSTSTIQSPPPQLDTSVDSPRLVLDSQIQNRSVPPSPPPYPPPPAPDASLLFLLKCKFPPSGLGASAAAVPPSMLASKALNDSKALKKKGSKQRAAEKTPAPGASSSAAPAASLQKAGKGIGQLETLWDTDSSEGGSPRRVHKGLHVKPGPSAPPPLAHNVRKTKLAQVNKAYERQAWNVDDELLQPWTTNWPNDIPCEQDVPPVPLNFLVCSGDAILVYRSVAEGYHERQRCLAATAAMKGEEDPRGRNRLPKIRRIQGKRLAELFFKDENGSPIEHEDESFLLMTEGDLGLYDYALQVLERLRLQAAGICCICAGSGRNYFGKICECVKLPDLKW